MVLRPQGNMTAARLNGSDIDIGSQQALFFQEPRAFLGPYLRIGKTPLVFRAG
jgi:hypothetical protein